MLLGVEQDAARLDPHLLDRVHRASDRLAATAAPRDDEALVPARLHAQQEARDFAVAQLERRLARPRLGDDREASA